MRNTQSTGKINGNPEQWLQIIACLRKDARMSLTKMSKATSTPITTLAGRIKVLEDKRIIKRYTAQVDFESLGFPLRLHITAKPKPGSTEALSSILKDHLSTNTLFLAESSTGDPMLLGDMVFASISELNAFTREMRQNEHCAKLETHYIQETINQEQFIPGGRA